MALWVKSLGLQMRSDDFGFKGAVHDEEFTFTRNTLDGACGQHCIVPEVKTGCDYFFRAPVRTVARPSAI